MFYSQLKSTTSHMHKIWAARCHGTFGTLRVKFMWLICGILRLARRSAIIFEKCQRRAEQRRWEINLLCSPAPAPLSTVPASTRAANEPSRSLKFYHLGPWRSKVWSFTILEKDPTTTRHYAKWALSRREIGSTMQCKSHKRRTALRIYDCDTSNFAKVCFQL